MKTLQEDIDDLDRMVDTGAAKDAMRSQIRLIAREVAALEAEHQAAHTSMQDSFAKLEAAHTKLTAEHETLKTRLAKRDADTWQRLARESHIEANYAPENNDA